MIDSGDCYPMQEMADRVAALEAELARKDIVIAGMKARVEYFDEMKAENERLEQNAEKWFNEIGNDSSKSYAAGMERAAEIAENFSYANAAYYGLKEIADAIRAEITGDSG